MFTIEEETLQSGAVLLYPHGLIDERAENRLASHFAWLFSRNCYRAIVDLSAYSDAPPDFIRCITAALWIAQRQGGSVVLVCPSAALFKKLILEGLSDKTGISVTLQDAEQRFEERVCG